MWGWSYFCGSFLCGAGLTSVGHSCVGLVLLLCTIPVLGWSYVCRPFLCGSLLLLWVIPVWGWSYYCGSFLCEAGLTSVGHSCVGLVLLLWIIPVWGCLTSVGHSCVGLVLLLWTIPVWGWSYFCGSFLCGAGLTSVSHPCEGLELFPWVILVRGWSFFCVTPVWGWSYFSLQPVNKTNQGNHYTPCNHQPNEKKQKKAKFCQTDRRQQPLKHSIREKSVAWFSVCCRLYRPDCKGSLHCSMNCCRSVFGKPLSWYS